MTRLYTNKKLSALTVWLGLAAVGCPNDLAIDFGEAAAADSAIGRSGNDGSLGGSRSELAEAGSGGVSVAGHSASGSWSAGGTGDTEDDKDEVVPPPSDSSWITVTSDCGFSLSAPPDVVESKVQGVDSCVAQYDANGCTYSADYGAFSSSFDSSRSQPNFSQNDVEIDGEAASLVSFGPDTTAAPYVAGVFFSEVRGKATAQLKFSARCGSAAAQATALQVYRTLRFTP